MNARLDASTSPPCSASVGRVASLGLVLAVLAAGCGQETASATAHPRTCPASAPATELLPGTRAEHLELAYWTERARGDLDRVLLDAEAIAEHNRVLAGRIRGGGLDDAAAFAERPRPASVLSQVQARLRAMHEQAAAGELVEVSGPLDLEGLGPLVPPRALPSLRPALHLVRQDVPLRCSPSRRSLYRRPIDRRFDRNLCSSLRPGDLVQSLLRWPNGSLLARTRYALGWLEPEGLSPPLSQAETVALLSSRPARHPELTRRAVLEEALSRVGQAYGWAGADGATDCSQLTMEIFASFGLHLPRNSGAQALAGTEIVNLGSSVSEQDRERLLDRAAERGVVLLAWPGHVMLYLGRTIEGTPMVLHALAEYVEPCEGGGETIRRVDRITVSTLALGRGTSRGSLLSRVTAIALFAPGQ